MSGLVFRPIGPVDDALVVLDSNRRLYAGLSRDGSYWHVVQPAQVDLVNADGATARSAGQLVCGCKGGAFRGTCYRVEEAEAFEGTRDAAATSLTLVLDSPAGAGEAVEAFRG